MSDIVITEFMDESAIDELSAHFRVHYSKDLADKPDELKQALTFDTRAIIVRNKTEVDLELLKQAPKLEVLGRLGVGLDNIDLDACKERGVTVYTAAGANDIAVAEYVVTVALILSRNVYNVSNKVIAGSWPRLDCIGRELHGQILGLIGCGSIARETARRFKVFGMKILAYDPYLSSTDKIWLDINRVTDIEELVREADIISLHVPLSESTRNLIDTRLLSKVKPGVLIINTSRGGSIDELALIQALRDGRIGGAAIDVFSHEPLNEEGGRLFAGVPNLLLTPHIAGVTEQSNKRVSRMIANRVSKHLGIL